MSGPLVEAHIVDRPGVPASLDDKYWMYRGNWNSFGQAGEVGTTARIVLRDELVLAADAGLVVSYAVVKSDEGSEDIVVGPDGVTLIVRDIRTGATVRTFDTPVAAIDGVMAGTRLFWFGNALETGAPKRLHRAVFGLDLADPNSVPLEIAPAPGQDYGSSPLRISDQGQVVMRNLGRLGEVGGVTQVFDVSKLSLRATVEGELVLALHGDRALMWREEEDVVLRDFDTGDRIGPSVDTSELFGIFLGDGEVFLQHGRADDDIAGVYITAMDLDSGRAREVLFQGRDVRTTLVSADLSTAADLVLLNDDWDYGADGLAYVVVSLLNPRTGEIRDDAFTLGGP